MATYGYVTLVMLLTFQGILATSTDDLEAIRDTLQQTIDDTLQNSPLSDPNTASLLTRGLQTLINSVGIMLMSALVAFGLYSLLTWEKTPPYYYSQNTGYGAGPPTYDATGQAYTKSAYRTPDQAYAPEQTFAVHQTIEEAAKKYK
ncbi:uncharacterized protein [Macrobrachium rosenbergii]|uniref:uncharacterized protein n=1 Tax=Macrobrachium rosenbergii TaxID=79674 RepID=UPI0034D50D7D